MYPFNGYGYKKEQAPKQEDVLIKNVTVWTNEKEGRLENTDVLLKNGKIAAIGKGLSIFSEKKILKLESVTQFKNGKVLNKYLPG